MDNSASFPLLTKLACFKEFVNLSIFGIVIDQLLFEMTPDECLRNLWRIYMFLIM